MFLIDNKRWENIHSGLDVVTSYWSNNHSCVIEIFFYHKKKKNKTYFSCKDLKVKSLAVLYQTDTIISVLLQMSWDAGTQCVTKGDHRKPKPGELAYNKGDILTIVDRSTVLSWSYRQRLFRIMTSNRLTHESDRSFPEEGILQGQTQHHGGGRTHKLQQCAWKTGSARASQPQPHAVRLPVIWMWCWTVRHYVHFQTTMFTCTLMAVWPSQGGTLVSKFSSLVNPQNTPCDQNVRKHRPEMIHSNFPLCPFFKLLNVEQVPCLSIRKGFEISDMSVWSILSPAGFMGRSPVRRLCVRCSRRRMVCFWFESPFATLETTSCASASPARSSTTGWFTRTTSWPSTKRSISTTSLTW